MARVFRPQAISFSGLGSNFRRQRMVRAPEYAVRGRRWMDCIAAWEAASDRAGRESTYSSPRTSSSGLVRPALMSSIASCQRGSSLSRLCVGLSLAIPSVVEIHVGQTLEKLRLLSLGQLLNRFDDFTDRAHAENFNRNVSDEKSKERIKEEGRMEREGARPASAEATARQAWKAK